MKACTKCGAVKLLNEFYVDKKKADGHTCQCKTCMIEYQKRKKEEDKEEWNRKQRKRYRKRNPKKLKRREYTRECRTCCVVKPLIDFHKSGNGERHYHCKLCRNQKGKEERTPESNRKSYLKQQTLKAREKMLLEQQGKKKCTKCNEVKDFEEFSMNGRSRRSHCKECRRKHYKKRLKEDPQFRIRHNTSRRILLAIKTKKQKPTMELVGCSIEELIVYLEDRFLPGMTWDNYGREGWHIDHIKPCSIFDLTDLEQQKECFHYTNLQPLWALDNIKKGNKYEENIGIMSE